MHVDITYIVIHTVTLKKTGFSVPFGGVSGSSSESPKSCQECDCRCREPPGVAYRFGGETDLKHKHLGLSLRHVISVLTLFFG